MQLRAELVMVDWAMGGGRLEPFSDSIATGLGWLFSVQGVVVGFVMTIISSLLIAVIVDEPSYDLIGGWIGDRRRTLYLRWLDAAENKLQRFFGSHLLGLRAFDRCLLLALAYPLFLLLRPGCWARPPAWAARHCWMPVWPGRNGLWSSSE
jgi:hypothetical protein